MAYEDDEPPADQPEAAMERYFGTTAIDDSLANNNDNTARTANNATKEAEEENEAKEEDDITGEDTNGYTAANASDLEHRPPHDISAWLNMVLLVSVSGSMRVNQCTIIYFQPR
jgi:hypothetical protein